VTTSLSLSRSPLIYKVVIHEMIPRLDQYPDDWKSWDFEHEQTDLTLPQEKSHSRVSFDEDSGCWPLVQDTGLTVVAAALRHRVPSWGFVITERSGPGRLNTERLGEIGIRPGPIYGKLKAGQKVTLDSGVVLDPEEYLGPPVHGRSLAILGDTCDSSELLTCAPTLDVLVHEATMENKLREKCVEFGHSTPSMAASVAHSVRAGTLILFHVSPRYRPVSMCDDSNRHESAEILLNEAVAHLNQIDNTHTNVMIAEDFTEFSLSKHKS